MAVKGQNSKKIYKTGKLSEREISRKGEVSKSLLKRTLLWTMTRTKHQQYVLMA